MGAMEAVGATADRTIEVVALGHTAGSQPPIPRTTKAMAAAIVVTG
jgi:hypothetical protein